ncbi:MAG: ZIP family metal transporter [Planctomycetes bacterium]|nr:ZIP family metal transporter [Planctomycetota bacterium]
MPLQTILLACALTAAASILGGLIPLCFRISHRWMQVLLSLIAGVMAGVAAVDLLPHAIEGMTEIGGHGHGHGHDHGHYEASGAHLAMLWAVGGFLGMYLLERFFCFHHHEQGEGGCSHAGHGHTMSWVGAATGLSVHALLAGIGLGAAILLEGGEGVVWPGLGMLLAISLHKPFDGLAIVTLMNRDHRGVGARWAATLLYAAVTPVGIALAWLIGGETNIESWAAPAVAVTAGLLLCIALSDILPELQYHTHDRLLLSGALVVGLLIAVAASYLH